MSDPTHRSVPLEDALAASIEPMPAEARDRVRSRVMAGIDSEGRLASARVLFMRSAAAFAATATLMAGTGYAAASSLPGDPLYSLKRAAEEIRIAFSPDAQQGETLMNLTRERTREVRQLIESEADKSDIKAAAEGFGEAAGRAVRSQPDSASAEQAVIEIQDVVDEEPESVQEQVQDKVPSTTAAPNPNPTPAQTPSPAQGSQSAPGETQGEQAGESPEEVPGPGEPQSPNGVTGQGR